MRPRVRSLRSDALDDLVVRWAPRDLDQMLALVDRLTAAGVGRARAVGIAEWLARRVIGGDDRTSDPTRTIYRKTLREVESAGYDPPSYSGIARVALVAA